MKTFYIWLILLLTGILFYSQKSMAVTAYPHPTEYQLPDGSYLLVQLKGDEKIKWAKTPDGYSLLFNKDGFYEYAVLNRSGDLIPSGVRAGNPKERTKAETDLLAGLPKGLLFSKSQVEIMRQFWEIKNKEGQKAFPTTGSRSLVCILMGFTDKAFTKTQSDFNNLFNQVNYSTDGATGSVKDYFNEASYNQFNLTVTVAGPYTAANNMAYYGANDADGYDLRPDVLVTEAVNAANASVDFSDFDNDSDGNVDGVYVIYAGYGEEAGASANAIWAHAWEISPTTLDGTTITTYSCSSELRGTTGTNLTRIGVICHEFGHVLGAPDFYDTDYETNGEYDGMGEWDLQASGSWNNNGTTPAHPNAYTKIYIYSWAAATTISSAASLTLNNSAQNSGSFYRYNTGTTNEFFLLENRQLVGFDAYVPGHGMLVYHADGTYINNHDGSNDINVGSHQGLYPVSAVATTANGVSLASANKVNVTGCPWPGTSSKTTFTDATTPNAKSWAGVNTAKPITAITENTTLKTISFDFMGGGATPTITLSVSSLNFEKVYSGYSSRPQSYTVTGANLTGNVTVTAPTGMRVASSCTGTYGSTLTLTPSGGAVNATVYAKYTGGTVSSNISHVSSGATTKNISISETSSTSNLPGSYYSSATGSGATLKTNLKNIVTSGHSSVSYTSLWTHFQTTDARPDGKVWDIYTDNPCGTSCSFTFGSDQDDGTGGTAECQKYNREHTFPASWFNDATPTYTDLFHLMPTDKYVNNQRSSYCFGEVGSGGTTYNNGGKLGTNSYSGAPANTCYEPSDDYKGDVARNYFYLATRYESEIDAWEALDINSAGTSDDWHKDALNGTEFPCFDSWFLNMLMAWHTADPVDQKELSRNDAIYTIQGNRNPFIDHPEYVNSIWGTNPALSVTPSTLSGFSYTVGAGPSTAQSFALTGSNLDGSSVTVSGSTNYEVSLSSGSGYGASVNVNYTAPTLSSTTIYVRLKSGLSAASYNGETVTCNDNGAASNVTVSCYGQVNAAGGNTYTKITNLTDLTDGYYVVVNSGDGMAMNNTNAGSYFGNTSVSPSSNTITNPDASIVWKIMTHVDGGRTIYNEASAKYVSYSGSSNAAYAVDAVTSGNQRWTFTYASSVFSAANVTTAARILQYNNSSPRFACYTTAQQKLLLYKQQTSSTPTITLSASTLTGFSYAQGYGPSASQTYNLMASNLSPASGDLTVTGSANFEVSTDNSVFGASITVAYTSGSLSATPIYVRLKSGLTAANYNSENIANSGGGATSVNLSCSGTVSAAPSPEISVSASSFSFGEECIADPSAEQSYTVSGNYLSGDIVITPPTAYEISTGTGGSFVATNPITLTPESGAVGVTEIFVRFIPTLVQSYTGNISHQSTGATTQNLALSGSGVNLAPSVGSPSSGNITGTSADLGGNITSIGCSPATQRGVFYSTTSGFADGTGTKAMETGTFNSGTFSVSVSGLTAATTYYFKAYAINGADTGFSSQGNFSTIKPEPSNHVSNFTAIPRSSSQIDLSWTDATGTVLPTGYLVKASIADSFTDPADGTDPDADNDLADGSALVKVLHGSKGGYSFTGLSASTMYYFKIWPYSNTGSAIDFKTGSEPSVNDATQEASASAIASWVLTSNGTASGVNANITAGDFTKGSGVGSITYGASGAYANGWSTGTLDASDYFQVSLSPNSGYMINISTVNFTERRSNTGIRDYQLRWSKNADFSSATTIATVNVPDNDLERVGNITGLDITVNFGETIYLRWFGYTAEAGTGTWRMCDNTLSVEGTVSASSPTINVTPSTLSGFTYVLGNGPSAEQNFSISGSNLTNDISIVPSTNYEISTQTGGSFAATNPVTLTQSGGNVSSTTIYVRLKAGLVLADYNSETITTSSTDASNKIVTCSGSVTAPSPVVTLSVSSLTGFSNVSGTASASQNYTVSGDYLTGDVTVTAPTDFEVSVDNSSFSASVILAQSGGNITGEPKTVYVRIKASAVAGAKSGNVTHESSGATTQNLAVSGTVYKIEPSNHTTSFTATAASESQINLSWTDAIAGSQAPDTYLILANTTGTFSDPADATDPAEDSNMGDGTGVFKVAYGVQAKSVTGLSASTQYYFKIFPYTNSGSQINFKTDGAPQTANATTNAGSNSCASDLIISEYYEGASNDKYIEIYNNTGSTVDLSGYQVAIYANGNSSASSTIELTGSLNNKSTFVLSHSSANGTILGAANQTSGNLTFTGNDAVALIITSGSVLVDVIGEIGTDPGSEWGSGLTSTADNTLVRNSNVTAGDYTGSDAFDPSAEWTGYANTTTYMGSHTMDCTIDPEPSNQVTNFAVGTVTTTAIPLTWTAAEAGSQAPDGYLLKLNTGVVADPADGTDPANITAVTSGAANKKVTPGTAGSTTSFTGMVAGTMYNYKIYSYTNTGTSIDFNLSSPPSLNYATLPAVVTSPAVAATGTTTADLSWVKPGSYSDANHSILVFMKASSAVTAGTPTNASSAYTAETAFSTGTTYQNDAAAYCVYKGDGTTVSITGLTANTTYHILILTVVDLANYNASYSYSAAVTANGTTKKAEPSNQVTNFAVGTVTTTAIPLSWTAAATGSQAPDGYLLKLNTVTVVDPVDGTDPADVTAITSGAANKKITPGSASSATTFTGMVAGTMYNYKIYSYTNTGTYINYNLSSPPALNYATLPAIVTSQTITATGTTTVDITWAKPGSYSDANHSILVFVKATSAVTTGTPTSSPSVYNADAGFMSGTAYQNDASAYCVYKGDGTSVSVTGLTESTTYHVLIYTVVDAANYNTFCSYSAAVTTNGTTQSSSAPETIWFQGFEGTGSDTWTITTGTPATATGSGDTPANQRIRTGSKSWQANNTAGTLELQSKSVSGYSNIKVVVYLSSTSTTVGNGAEATDFARIFVALNGGAFAANLEANADICIKGNLNARWSYNDTENATTNAGTNLVVSGTSGTNQGTIYSKLVINIPNGTNFIALRINTLNNDVAEVWNVDDIEVVGVLPGFTPPTITAQPLDLNKCAGENTSFTVEASGTITGYQWVVNTGDGIWTDLTNNGIYGGVTTLTLSLTGVTTTMNNYQYCVKVINQECSTYSNSVKLLVNPRPAEPLINETDNQCGQTVLTRGTPADGSVWYWQGTNATGTSTADNAATDTVLQGLDNTYYLRAQFASSSCWSETSASQVVTVKIKPVVSLSAATPGCGEGSIQVNSDQNAQQVFELLDQNGDALSPAKIWSGIAENKIFEGINSGNYKAKVALENGCESDLPGSSATLTNNLAVPEPSVSDAFRCGSGTIVLLATASSGNEMQFFEHSTTIPDIATVPTSTDNSEPYQHTTASLTNPQSTRVWARMANTVTGCKSQWVAATASTEGERGIWTGAGSDSYWTTTDNWSDCTVPLIADDVIIPTGRSVIIDANVVCKDISVDGGASLTIESGNLLTVSGNVDISESASISILGTLVMNGSSLQTIVCDTLTLYNLSIDNAAGVRSESNLEIENTLNLATGILSMADKTLTIGTSSTSRGSITGTFGPTRYIAAYKSSETTAGKIKMHVNNSQTFIFPIGDNDEYSPVSIGFTAGSFASNANVEVYVADEKHPEMGDPTWYLTRYWKYEPTGISSATYNIDFTYLDGDVFFSSGTLADAESHIYPVKHSTTGWVASRCESDPTYDFSRQYGEGEGANNPATNVLSWTGVHSFSEGSGAGGTGGALPVELIYFKAYSQNDKIELHWATASETNNHYFTLKKSENALDYETLAIVNGQGNTASETKYSFTDQKPVSGIAYYKLCQTDYDGLNRCPGFISVKTNSLDYEVLYYLVNEPDLIKIFSDNIFEGSYQLEVFDQMGRLIYNKEHVCNGDESINIPAKLIKGNIYYLKIIKSGKPYPIRFVH